MSLHRYPLKSVIGDYLRAAAGLIIALGLLLSGALPWFVTLLFSLLALLFGLFALRTMKRHYLEVSLEREAITTHLKPVGQTSAEGRFKNRLDWQDLKEVKLRYFGSRRAHKSEGGGGFMQLTLTGRGSNASGGQERKTTMSFESSLEGFSEIVRRAVDEARRLKLKVDPTTAGNLLPLGIDIDAQEADEQQA